MRPNLVKNEEEEEEEELEDDLDDLFYEAGDGAEETPASQQIEFGHRLTAPRPASLSCESLVKMIDREKIDLEADYQRDIVWNSVKQSTLIDSIYRNYYIPPILFSLQTVVNNEGDQETIRVCIDGKQRLESIRRFMKNEIPMREPITGRTFYFKPKGGSTRSISQAKRDTFSQIQMSCIEYENLTLEVEHDMFQRVQLGMHLTSGEKLNAEDGPWAEFTRELMKRFFALDPTSRDLDDKTDKPWNHVVKLDRGKDFLLLGYSCLLYSNRDVQLKAPTVDALRDLYKKKKESPSSSQKKGLIDAIVRWAFIANSQELNTPFLRRKSAAGGLLTLAPVEFLFTIYMCHRYPGASDKELSDLFKEMRRRVRLEHKDIMINSKITATVGRYFEEVEDKHPAYLVPLSSEMNDHSSNSSRKRLRDEDEDEDEEDDDRLPLSQQYNRLRVN